VNPLVALFVATLVGVDGGMLDPSAARVYAAEQAKQQYEWGSDQFACLDDLWHHESGWNMHADNPTSSAYGIPQALTELHGLDDTWKVDARAQIDWGLDYIAQRYETPCQAWEAWKSRATLRDDGTYWNGWY